MCKYCNVVIFRNTRALDQLYTYEVPAELESLVKIGKRVAVDFGRANKSEEALVISFANSCDYKNIKSIKSVFDDGICLDEKAISAILWLKNYYICTYAEAIMPFLPSGVINNRVSDKKESYVELAIEPSIIIKQISKRNIAQIRFIEYLSDCGRCSVSEVYSKAKINKTTIDKMSELGFVNIITKNSFRRPKHYNARKKGEIVLNKPQSKAYESVNLKDGQSQFFLQGVTGSGKTEVYLKWVYSCLENNRQALVLVPEIALTAQIVNRFIENFGDRVAVFHSGLSMGERYDQWKAVKDHRCDVVLGTRSALFVPLDNIGIIILDEAHDDSYKSSIEPKYNAVDVANHFSHLHNCPVIFGSATLDMMSAYRIKNGEYKKLLLPTRHNNKPLPNVEIIDMREELKNGNRSVFSYKMYDAINKRLNRGEQSILFLNRKGFSTFVSCRSCGFSLKCPDCEIALTYYKGANKAICNYCGYSINIPKVCPDCKSSSFRYFGTGTEKLEMLAKQAFPNARIERLDREVIRKKGQLNEIMYKIENKEIDILIGTQMVTKGLDFENVTLVGCLSADVMLNLPDFRSSEKTFQTLIQVAGRAGRGDLLGEVLIQSYTPHHFALTYMQKYDEESFIDEELNLRKRYDYPPFYRLSIILIRGTNESHVNTTSKRVAYFIKQYIVKNKLKNFKILGPNPAIYSKIRGKFRYQIIIKTPYDMRDNVAEAFEIIKKERDVIGDSTISIDIDAISLL